MGLTLLALTMVAVIGFALLALFATRNGSQLISAFLATGMWLFLASSVLIWLWRRASLLLRQELGKRRQAEAATQKDEAQLRRLNLLAALHFPWKLLMQILSFVV